MAEDEKQKEFRPDTDGQEEPVLNDDNSHTDSGISEENDTNGDDDDGFPLTDEDRTSVIPVVLDEEMKTSYIDYSMSVIIGRALPDARDGLKPVHRRILYSMNETGITSDKPYKKSARVVGDVLGKYHPHGDSSVYDAIVRLVQDFSLRYPLIDGQGNFGSVDGDSAAAMRYTEVRLDKIADEMVDDIGKETVDMQPNYDGSLEEPSVLPAKLPCLLINGSTGIAVGMATNMPPHNLTEVIDATLMMIDDPEADVEKLMTVIKGPDFPTGAQILGTEGIISAYKTGRGSIRIRSVAAIEDMKGDRQCIVVTELPYQVNKARLIENIAGLVRDKVISGISDLRDESDREGIRVVIELSKGTNAEVILNQLYRHTQLQVSYGIINLAIVNGTPKVLSLREILQVYLKHRLEIIRRRTAYDLRIAKEREHILEGLKIAIDNIDDVIELIKKAPDAQTARTALMERYSLDEAQSKAILDMRLQRLTGLEMQKIADELTEILKKISEYEEILASDSLKYGIIRKELEELKERFGDERRTQIVHGGFDIIDEDLIQKEDVVITLTSGGYIKRLPAATYKSQKRGGKGIIGMETNDGDVVEKLFISSTHSTVLFFTNKGRVYARKGYDIPEAGRNAKGRSIANLLDLKDKENESVKVVLPVDDFREDVYVMTASKKGMVKKTPLSDFRNIRRTGITAVSLKGVDEADGDELVNVILTDGSKNIIMASRFGKAACFSEEEVRPMGRSARGVIGMNLVNKDDRIVSMEAVNNEETLLTVTENGYGKRTSFDEYAPKHRGSQGVVTIVTNERNGYVTGVCSVPAGGEIMAMSTAGIIIRTGTDDISLMSRNTQGVRIMDLKDAGNKVAGIVRVDAAETSSKGEDTSGNGSGNDPDTVSGNEDADASGNEGADVSGNEGADVSGNEDADVSGNVSGDRKSETEGAQRSLDSF